MRTLLPCLLAATASLGAQAPRPPATAPTADSTFYSVAYLEVRASNRTPAIQALKQYKDACRLNDNSLRTELFEQADRPGHRLLVETWKSQTAFDAGTPAIRKRLTDAVEPIRLSGWD